MTLTMRAPAKINLSLHIRGRRADGYHELESLVAFAGASDLLTLQPDRPLGLSLSGPTAAAAGASGDNLVLRAVHALAERVAGLRAGAFHLVKRLPVGAGIGGGSADAAAALRLLALANDLAPDDPRLFAAAAAVGADVPVCVAPRARMMCGIGDRLGPALRMPPLAAVLANPGVHLETRSVFAAVGLQPGERAPGDSHPAAPEGAPGAGWTRLLGGLRNDMEPAARRCTSAIGDVLDALAGCPGARLVRMSGSGTTCFALFDDCRAAAAAAARVRQAQPAWWIRPTVLR